MPSCSVPSGDFTSHYHSHGSDSGKEEADTTLASQITGTKTVLIYFQSHSDYVNSTNKQ